MICAGFAFVFGFGMGGRAGCNMLAPTVRYTLGLEDGVFQPSGSDCKVHRLWTSKCLGKGLRLQIQDLLG